MGPGDVCRAPTAPRGHSPAHHGLGQDLGLRDPLSRSAAFRKTCARSAHQASGPTSLLAATAPDGSVEQGLMKRERLGGLPCGRKSPRGRSGVLSTRRDPCLPPRQWQTLGPTASWAAPGSSLPHSRQEGPGGLPGGSTCQGLTPFPPRGSPAPGAQYSQTRCSGPAAHDVRT